MVLIGIIRTDGPGCIWDRRPERADWPRV